MKKGRPQTLTHDYKRNGTTTLFAALNTLDGVVIGQCLPRHRHQEWLKFLRQIERESPPELDSHLIVDNYATHKHPKVKSWLNRHPRFHTHFTPTSASWLNMVEGFFRDLNQNAIRTRRVPKRGRTHQRHPSLGIPGSPTAAVLLGGLLIWGLQPGPLLFVEQKDFVWGLIASMYLGNIAGLLIVLTCVPLFAAILRIPFSIIAPIIIVICAIGAYTVHNAMLDIWLMLLFGVVGYVFKKLDYPLAPLVLALVLGDRAEDSFRQSMIISQGDIRVFFSDWLVGGITALALLMLFWPLIGRGLARVRGGRSTLPEPRE